MKNQIAELGNHPPDLYTRLRSIQSQAEGITIPQKGCVELIKAIDTMLDAYSRAVACSMAVAGLKAVRRALENQLEYYEQGQSLLEFPSQALG